jgi:hypothetical protein
MKNMRTRRVIAFLALMLMLSAAIAAEEFESPYETFPQALGGSFGRISGIGLHYHKWAGENAFQVTGGLIYNMELLYSIGGEYQRRVYGEAFTNWLAGSLYLFAGGSFVGVLPGEINAGAGVGVELILFRHLSIPLEFGYVGTWSYTAASLSEAFSVGPTVQAGLRYRY